MSARVLGCLLLLLAISAALPLWKEEEVSMAERDSEVASIMIGVLPCIGECRMKTSADICETNWLCKFQINEGRQF